VSQPSRDREDLATLSAVAEAVVNLSIAERTQTMYGSSHPIAVQSRGTASHAIDRALELIDPVVLRFTPLAVFCGPHCLERDHPIYRRFAKKLWELGMGELRISRGVTPEELTRFLEVLAEGTRSRASHRAMERCLAQTDLPHLRVRTLRQLVETEVKLEVSPLTPEEERKHWDLLMRRLGKRPEGAPPPGDDPEPPSERTAPIEDYATAVVDYMRQVQRVRRQEEILVRSESGQKLVDLLEQMNPELRHQILSQAIVTPDIDAAFLARLADLTGREAFVESLRRLNAQGEALPPTVFQTLALLSSVAPEGDVEGPESLLRDAGQTRGTLAQGLGALFAADERESYVTPDYDRTLERLQDRFRRPGAPGSRPIRTSLDLSGVTTERHFLFTMQEILDGSGIAEREDLRRRAIPEVERSFLRLVEAERFVACREAVRLAQELRAEEVEEVPDLGSPPWEQPGFLDSLLGAGDEPPAAVADDLRALLVAIGSPVVEGLAECLRDEERLTARKLAVDTLVALEASPAPALLPLLQPDEPWSVHHNVLHVLGARNDPAAAGTAAELWPAVDSRSRSAILRYLIDVGDPRVEGLLREALCSDDAELVLAAARMAFSGDRLLVRSVMAAARRAAETRRASPLHYELLRLIAHKGGREGRAFVERARTEHAPRMPWRRTEWRSRIDRILGDAP
jgi:hypothetical protein